MGRNQGNRLCSQAERLEDEKIGEVDEDHRMKVRKIGVYGALVFLCASPEALA
jgi:hypothetical protein